MSIQLSTAGVHLGYAPELVAGTRPTTGYVDIIEMKEIPENNPAPENLETTNLAQTEYKTYIPGLKDPGGALTFKANMTEAFIECWDALVEAYHIAKAAGKAIWFRSTVPGMTQAWQFTGVPSALGMPAMGVNAVLETSVFITPTSPVSRYALDAPAIGNLTVTSAAGATTGKTKLSVSPAKADAAKYKVKFGATASLPTYDDDCGVLDDWDGVADIEAVTGQKVLVIECTSANRARKAGIATVTSKV